MLTLGNVSQDAAATSFILAYVEFGSKSKMGFGPQGAHMTTTTDWPTGSSDHAASNVKTATIIQFVPRANPKRTGLVGSYVHVDVNGPAESNLIGHDPDLAEAFHLGHPWSGEDKA